MSVTPCPTCRRAWKPATAPECADCRRRRRYAAIVVALTSEVDELPLARSTLDALEALGELMVDRQRMLREHRKEMFEEQRGAQRDAHEAYRQGISDGRSDRGDW